MNNKVTIVLTTYNRADTFLRRAIDGILNQTYREFDFVIIDHGSTDNTREVISEYRDPRIRYKYVRGNEDGCFCNMQRAVYSANTEYVIWTHDDDRMYPEMIAREVEILDADKSIGLVSVNAERIDAEGKPSGICFLSNAISSNQFFKKSEFINHFLSVAFSRDTLFPLCPTVLYRTECIKELFEERIVSINDTGASMDVYVSLRLNQNYGVAILSELLFGYGTHLGQENANDTHMIYFRDVINPFLHEDTKCRDNYDHYIKRFNRDFRNYEYSLKIQDLLKNKISQADVASFFKDVQEISWEDYPDYYSFNKITLRWVFLWKKFQKKQMDYLIWGVGAYGDYIAYELKYLASGLQLIGYIDSFKSGNHNNHPIHMETDYDFTADTYIVVTSTSNGTVISEKLEQHGKKPIVDFMPMYIGF